MSTVQLDDLPTHVQTDARTAGMAAIVELLVFEAEELVEDAGPECGGHPGTGVGDADRTAASTVVEPLGDELDPLIVMVPPLGVYLSAFDSRLSNTTRSRRWSPMTLGRSDVTT